MTTNDIKTLISADEPETLEQKKISTIPFYATICSLLSTKVIKIFQISIFREKK